MRARNFELEAALNTINGTSRYTNMVIATAREKGKTVTEDWLRRHMLQNVEDGLVDYDEALNMNEIYTKKLSFINNF